MRKVLLMLALAFGLNAADKELVVFNWSEYMPESVLEGFENETGIQVKYSTYDSNEAMYAKVKTAGAESYDILVPSTYFVNKMSKEGLLAKIDKSKLKNYANLDPKLLGKPYDPKNDYSVPYLWGSTGISYNAGILGEGALTSWDDLGPQIQGQTAPHRRPAGSLRHDPADPGLLLQLHQREGDHRRL